MLKEAQRHLVNEAESKIYAAKIKTHQQRISALKADIAAGLKTSARTGGSNVSSSSTTTTMGSSSNGEDRHSKYSNYGEAKSSMDRTANYQKATINSLKQTAKLTADSEEVAAQATTTLKGQGDQLRENQDKLVHIEGQVEKGKKELNAFIRRMMTDKIILCLGILIVLAIILVVVLKVTGGGSHDNAAATTPVPVPMTPIPTVAATPQPTPATTTTPTSGRMISLQSITDAAVALKQRVTKQLA